MAYQDDILALSPTHYWQLTSSDRTDSGGGTASNGSGSNISVAGTGLRPGATQSQQFSRGNGTISLPSTNTLNNLSITQRTVSMIVQPELDTLPQPLFATNGSDNYTSGLTCWLGPGMNPALSVSNAGTTTTLFSRALAIDTPAVLTFVYDAGTMIIYIDGREITRATNAPTSISAHASTARIGGDGSTSFSLAIPGGNFITYSFGGKLSDVAVWNSVLTPTQIFDTVFSQAALATTATVTFTDVPLRTEVRIFDRDNSLTEVGVGEEYLETTGDFAIEYPVTTVLNARFALVNVEERFDVVHNDVALPREGTSIPANLLLIPDRVYDNDFAQVFAPTSTSAPVVSGIGEVGQTLTLIDNGVWGKANPVTLTFGYQWLRNGAPIVGATGTTYVIVGADDGNVLTCEVTATNGAGSDSAGSNPISLLAQGEFWLAKTAQTGQTPGTARSTAIFDTELQDTTAGGITLSAGTITPPAGRYLMYYQLGRVASGLNGRGNVVVELQKNGTIVAGSCGSGYQRDTANDAWWANGCAIVEANGTDVFRLQYYRGSDSNTSDIGTNKSYWGLVAINNTLAFSHYQASDNQSYGATTYATVGLPTTLTETNASVISRSGNNITLAANTKYLVAGGVFFDSATTRSSRFSAFNLDGSLVAGSMGYSYLRSGSSPYGGPSSFAVIETGGSAQTLNLMARGPGPGGTPVNGNALSVGTASGIMIAELPSSAQYSLLQDNVGGQAVGTPTIDFGRQVVNNDVFSSNTDASATFANDGDYFVAGSIMVRRVASNGTRLTREARFLLDGVEQTETCTGEYNRGDQGSQDCYDSAHNPRGIIPGVTAGQVLTLVLDENSDTGWNDGGGSPVTNISEPLGVYALDMASVK